MDNKCWMLPPFGDGEPKEVDARPEVLIPMMTAGWNQCAPPVAAKEVKTSVHN